jgi:hypothetical protein
MPAHKAERDSSIHTNIETKRLYGIVCFTQPVLTGRHIHDVKKEVCDKVDVHINGQYFATNEIKDNQ